MNNEDEAGSSGTKKQDHNAKERIRRMKLNASFLALRALLPDSRRSKKKWSAPAIVDRVLKYIPELEQEIESLRNNKENVRLQAKCDNINRSESPMISLTRVNEEEAIIQICMLREDESKFTNLLQTVDDELPICIRSASALYVSDNRICYHLQVQTTNTISEGDYHFQELLDKVYSCLR